MNKISAIIVAKDNPPHLEETISSIRDFVAEIIIVDIGLREIPSGVKVIKLNKSVPYVELIREEIKQYAAYDWILFVDPDEIISENLKKEIRGNLNQYDYFSMPRKNIIFGRWIQNSRWWPDYQVRLFRKNKVIWPKQIHQQPEVTGNGLVLEPKEDLAIIHHNYQNMDEFLEKAIRYAKSEAAGLVGSHKELTLSNTIKKSLSEFISRFFAHNGYKDGMHGFALAIMQMFYYFFVYFYYWELKKYPSIDTLTLVDNSQQFFKEGFKETNYWIANKKLGKASSVKSRIINKLLEL